MKRRKRDKEKNYQQKREEDEEGKTRRCRESRWGMKKDE